MYLRIIIALLLFQFINTENIAQYRVSEIPANLTDNAHSVIREYYRHLEVKSVNTSTEKVKIVITIFDKLGEESSILALSYDKNSSITINKIVYYDANGEKLKSAKSTEIQDHPYSSNSELFSDGRIKYFSPKNSIYPYSIEYDYIIDSKNDISYGCWRPVRNFNTSLQHAKLVLIHPSKQKINCREYGIVNKKSETLKNQNSITWELENIEAYEDEPFNVALSERVPQVYLMPDIFLYDEYEGSSSDWKAFGKWIFKLYENKNVLPVNVTEKIQELVAEEKDTLTRIRKVYEYMQMNTRYVAISLGIGGFQPADAESVSRTGYGECKALSNYTSALLNCIGIKSYPALVASGNYQVPIYKDFPNFQQFDHVILCVPVKEDTIWLECTNSRIPFGFLGDFTDDRSALLITEQGGVFAHTSVYDENDNKRTCVSSITINSQGSADIKTETKYYGLQYNDIREMLESESAEQKKWLNQNSKLPAYSINPFSIKENRSLEPEAIITENALSKDYCNLSGNYLVLPLNKINQQEPVRKMLKKRLSDIIINRSFTDYDTLTITYPENMVIESLPAEKNLFSEFGEYRSSVEQVDNTLVYKRSFKIKKGKYEPEKYTTFYNFILDISKADNTKVLLQKK